MHVQSERLDPCPSALRQPVTVWRMPPEMASVVRSWVRVSLSATVVANLAAPDGTVVLRTGGTWDSLLGFVDRRGATLTPLVIFKNPVPLWQSSCDVLDGVIGSPRWPRLRRVILIHNPGLDGFLSLVDEVVNRPLG